MNDSPETCTLRLFVYHRGYQCASFVYEGPRPAWPYHLKYKRGDTARHGTKEKRLERGHGADCHHPMTFQVECRPSELVEWQEKVLPQNGFTLVLPPHL